MENNKKNKLIKILAIALIILIIIFLVVYCVITSRSNKSDNKEIIREGTNLNIEYSNNELTGEFKEYKAKIILSDNNTSVEGTGVSNNGNEIIISSAGTYYITGNLSDGNINIEAGKDDDVQLILDNCSITSKSTAVINGIKCNVLTITLAENSKNILTDSENYTKFTDTEKQEPDGTIFTKTDLVINGTGALTVNSNYLDGIVSKDGLKIINSNITINSKDDGIRGKDYVAINSANIKIEAQGDGIKATNDEDEQLGYVLIEGGTININAKTDGIQAETILNISENAKIDIVTTNPISKSTNTNGMQKNNMPNMPMNNNNTTSSTDSVSSKGIKAGTEITIDNGNINISSTDDAIHSNGIIIINNGNFNLSSEDDGIHADTNIIINGGTINLTKSYEGIESSYIEINDGKISLIASDDGVNVSGGADNSSMENRPGQNNFSQISDSNRKLVINGGDITVNASGDGLDANGSIYIYGGNILVKGPTNSGDAPLDFDGECIITGGNLIAYGSSGMFEAPSNNSTQNILVISLNGNSGDNIKVKDSKGNEIISFTTEKSYQVIVISNENLQNGETYNLYVNDVQTETLQITGTVTSNGFNQNGMGKQQMNKGGKGAF